MKSRFTFYHCTRLIHTYSIVAVDKEAGEMGVGVQSHYFSVGSTVPWVKPGVGVIATQSLVNVDFGPAGLEHLEKGHSPQETLYKLVGDDEGGDYRQVAILDAQGRVASYTGPSCIQEAGHVEGKDFAVQANMMLKDTVWNAMAEAFEDSKGTLAERMLISLKAAEEEGGDIRGKQSAAMVVVKTAATGQASKDYVLDLRVEDHKDPLLEMERLLKLYNGYQALTHAEDALEKGEMAQADHFYRRAVAFVPENMEIRYWQGISFLGAGRLREGMEILKEIFLTEPLWRELTLRLPATKLFNLSREALDQVKTL